jgi:hypothetical protein
MRLRLFMCWRIFEIQGQGFEKASYQAEKEREKTRQALK